MEFLDGVHAQPENLDRSREVVWSALLETDPGVLRYGTVAAVGMGASTHAAAVFAAELRSRHRPAYPLSASELLGDRVDLADAYVGISFSGRSRETVEALQRLTGSARLGLTNYPERAFGGAVDHVVPLGCGEDTRVSTLSYTATLQALGLLVERSTASAMVEWSALPEQAAQVLKTAPADAIATALGEVSSIDVVGSGHRYGSAGAASLLIREAAHTPTAAYETYEYLHGPLEVAAQGRGALVFGSGREIALAADLAGWGAPTVLVTDAEQLPDGLERDNLLVVRLPKLPTIAGCVLDILPVQLAVAELAERRGVRIELHHMPADTKLPESTSGEPPLAPPVGSSTAPSAGSPGGSDGVRIGLSAASAVSPAGSAGSSATPSAGSSSGSSTAPSAGSSSGLPAGPSAGSSAVSPAGSVGLSAAPSAGSSSGLPAGPSAGSPAVSPAGSAGSSAAPSAGSSAGSPLPGSGR